MAKFSYEARDGGGDMTTGVVAAASAEDSAPRESTS